MTQKILALFALLFVFSFFNAYADEPAPVLKPDVTENKAAPVPAPTPPASVSIPMPDVSGMVNILPRAFVLVCENGGTIYRAGYVKKGNENAKKRDVMEYFLGDEQVPFAALILGDEIIVYLDYNRDRIADLVANVNDPRVEGGCSDARKTKAE